MAFVLGANDTLFALDASSGKILWQKSFANPGHAEKPRTWLCADAPNDTPTLDKMRGLVFFITGDGKLRGLSMADGSEKLAPIATVAPFTRAWSLNLIDNVIYSTSGRALRRGQRQELARICRGHVGAAARRQRAAAGRQRAERGGCQRSVASRCCTSSIPPARDRRRPGDAAARRGDPMARWCWKPATGVYDPASGDFSESILKVAPKAVRLVDSFTPTNWRDNLMHDMSGSATPVVFGFAGKTLIAASQKESVLRLLDAGNLGRRRSHDAAVAVAQAGQ